MMKMMIIVVMMMMVVIPKTTIDLCSLDDLVRYYVHCPIKLIPANL